MNNISNGVIIVDEQNSCVQFMNTAARKINKRLKSRQSTSMLSSRTIFDRKRCYYEPINWKLMKSSDYKTVLDTL